MALIKPNTYFAGVQSNLGFPIANSLRFNDDDEAHLTRTFGAGGNRKTWTLNVWVKLGLLSVFNRTLFRTGIHYIGFGQTSNTDGLYYTWGGQHGGYFGGDFRDTTSWYMVNFRYDTTQAIASDRVRVEINGINAPIYIESGSIPLNADAPWNDAVIHEMGRNSSGYYDGLISEVAFVDGMALDSTSFGEFNATTGAWVPKDTSGLTFGTTGFLLQFQDGTNLTTLGEDSSSNGNDWTLNNFTTEDQLIDTPTNNFCVLNPLDKESGCIISNGGLDASLSTTSSACRGTFALNVSGDWFFEFQRTSAALATFCGIGLVDGSLVGDDSVTYLLDSNSGNLYNNGGIVAGNAGAAHSTGDYIGIQVRSNDLFIYKNGIKIDGGGTDGAWVEGLIGLFTPYADRGNAGATVEYNFGQKGSFQFGPPGSSLPLSTESFAAPSIVNPQEYFNTVIYEGTGSANPITGVGFQPDLVWIKQRTGSNNHRLHDAIRGVASALSSDISSPEATVGDFDSFDADGFTVSTTNGAVNASGSDYVAWCWKEDALPGFDMVSYVGNGMNRLINHDLGQVPKMIIVKNRDSNYDWMVYHAGVPGVPEDGFLRLNTTNAATDDITRWNDTAPTSTTFSVGTAVSVNNNTENHIAYLFADVEGFSRVDAYIGNGNNDGAFVWCGFKPQYLMIKKSTGADSWGMWDIIRHDTGNEVNTQLRAESNGAEFTTWGFDFLSNGFKIRTSNNQVNQNGVVYIFIAFAETPFKFAKAA